MKPLLKIATIILFALFSCNTDLVTTKDPHDILSCKEINIKMTTSGCFGTTKREMKITYSGKIRKLDFKTIEGVWMDPIKKDFTKSNEQALSDLIRMGNQPPPDSLGAIGGSKTYKITTEKFKCIVEDNGEWSLECLKRMLQ